MLSRNKKILKIILIVVASVLFLTLVLLLARWTRSIENRQRQTEFIDTLKEVVSVSGERGLLELAGIHVNDIYYGDEGVTIFKGDNSSWNYSAEELQNMAVFEMASPAVVNISTVADSSVSSFLDVSVSIGTGSGFFVSSDGYICTNNHVISGSTSITVTTADGTKYNATVAGTDQENDIAVLKIESKTGDSFPYLTFAQSDSLVVGQRVLAIGNPFGYDRTMAEGIISGLSRPIRDTGGHIMLGMIQTDATINPGNSGGPLLDTKGRVIGVCAEIYTSTGTSQGMNFAIAADTAYSSVQDLIKYGKVNRGWIDIVPVQLSSQIVEYAGLKVDEGILVSQLVPNGKAQAAGMRGGTQQVMYGTSVIYLGGDVITSVNGIEVSEYSDLFNALSNTRPRDKVTVIVNRNGSKVELKVELVERTSELVGWINR